MSILLYKKHVQNLFINFFKKRFIVHLKQKSSKGGQAPPEPQLSLPIFETELE